MALPSKKRHPVKKCIIFYEKLKAGEILLQEVEAVNIHESPFPKNQGRGKDQVMMPSLSEAEAEGLIPEGNPDLG